MLNETCTETSCFFNDVNDQTKTISLNIKRRVKQECFGVSEFVRNKFNAQCSTENTNNIFIDVVDDSNDVISNEINVKGESYNSSATCQENRASALSIEQVEYNNAKDTVNILQKKETKELYELHRPKEEEYLEKPFQEVSSEEINFNSYKEEQCNHHFEECQLQNHINLETKESQAEEHALHEEYIEMNYDEEIETSMQYYNSTRTSIPYQHELEDERERCEFEPHQEENNQNIENLTSVHHYYNVGKQRFVENNHDKKNCQHHRVKKVINNIFRSNDICDNNNKIKAFRQHAKEGRSFCTHEENRSLTKCDVLALTGEYSNCSFSNDANYLHDELPTNEICMLQEYNIIDDDDDDDDDDDNKEHNDEEKAEGSNAYINWSSPIINVNSSWKANKLRDNYILDVPLQQREQTSTPVDEFVTANSQEPCTQKAHNKVKHKRCKVKSEGADVPFSEKWLQRQAEIMKKYKLECHRRWLEEMTNPASINSSLSSLTTTSSSSSSSSSSTSTTATTSTKRANASNLTEVVTLEEVKQFTHNIKILLNTACKKDLIELRGLPASCFGDCTPEKFMVENCVSSCLLRPQQYKNNRNVHTSVKTSNDKNHEYEEQKTFYINLIKSKWKELASELDELCRKLINKTNCSETHKKYSYCEEAESLLFDTLSHRSTHHVGVTLNSSSSSSKKYINKTQFLEDKKAIVLKVFSLFIFGKSREFTVQTAENLREARNKRKLSLIKRLNESKQLFELPILYSEEEEVLPRNNEPVHNSKIGKANGNFIPSALNTCFLGESLYTTQTMENRKEAKKTKSINAHVNKSTSDNDDDLVKAKVVPESVHESNSNTQIYDDDNNSASRTKVQNETLMKNTTCIIEQGSSHAGSDNIADDEYDENGENGLSSEKSTRKKLDIDLDDNEDDDDDVIGGVVNGNISPNGLSPSSTTSSGDDDAENENFENNFCQNNDDIRIVCTDDTEIQPNILTTSHITQNIVNKEDTFTISPCSMHEEMPFVTLCKAKKMEGVNVSNTNDIVNNIGNIKNTATNTRLSSYKALFDFLYTVVNEQYDMDDTCNLLKHIRESEERESNHDKQKEKKTRLK